MKSGPQGAWAGAAAVDASPVTPRVPSNAVDPITAVMASAVIINVAVYSLVCAAGSTDTTSTTVTATLTLGTFVCDVVGVTALSFPVSDVAADTGKMMGDDKSAGGPFDALQSDMLLSFTTCAWTSATFNPQVSNLVYLTP